jgi:hypothetical protein
MAWLLLRNDQLVLYLCLELKDASFETLGAKVAELGLTLDVRHRRRAGTNRRE